MPLEENTRLGKVTWTEEVISTLVGNAATECAGVAGMAARGVGDGLAELLGRDSLSKGVEVAFQGGKASVTLNIVVEYGVRIPEVAGQVAERVRRAVVETTGIPVRKVHVNVQGVRLATPGQAGG